MAEPDWDVVLETRYGLSMFGDLLNPVRTSPEATPGLFRKAGTGPGEFGEAHFLWFKAMAEKGMTPMEAIVSATRNIAAAYHKLDRLGTLEPGKLADLVVLDANPLQDVNNIRKISLVMKDGQVVDRDKLPVKKVLSIPRRAPPRPTTSSSNGGGK